MDWSFIRSRDFLGRFLHAAARFLLACILAGAQLGGGFAPFAVGFTAAAGPGVGGFAALLGTAAGALLFLDFSHALRTTAAAILLFSANSAFCDTRLYRRPWFLPALSAALMLAVEFVYVLGAPGAEAASCALSLLLAALAAYCARTALECDDPLRERPAESLVLLLGVLVTLCAPELPNGFAPGRVAAALAVLLFAFSRDRSMALTAALAVGLAMDLPAPGAPFLHTATYGLAALATQHFRRGSRVRAALAFSLCSLVFALPLPAAQGLILLYENLCATLVFLLLPSRLLRAPHEASEAAVPAAAEETPDSALRRRLTESALALRELYSAVSLSPQPPEEEPKRIFDRAAEQVCRACMLRHICWEAEYGRTATALADATQPLLAHGRASGADFPAYFADRCIHFASFVSAVNAETNAFLLRRAYRSRLGEKRTQTAAQYARLSELLSATAETPAAAAGGAPALLPYLLGAALRPKSGEQVCGDAMRYFETADGTLYLLLSDGMGSGEAAHRESALAARLLERFLRAGVEPAIALKTLNGALALRAEASDSFTTLDLLRLDLHDLSGEVYKYGAAPSYVKQDGRVRRISCACLPAGLQDASAAPETTRLRLVPGSFFVMVTDGVADTTDDEWLQNLLAGWAGEDPQSLVAAVSRACRERRGEDDDASVLVLYLPPSALPAAGEV